MARDKFDQLWRYLHLQDNESRPQTPDKLWKMRWFVEYLAERFRTIYTPKTAVSIDESMVKFKGRLSFRQYLPAKPIKWGIKIWALCEPSTGYACDDLQSVFVFPIAYECIINYVRCP